MNKLLYILPAAVLILLFSDSFCQQRVPWQSSTAVDSSLLIADIGIHGAGEYTVSELSKIVTRYRSSYFRMNSVNRIAAGIIDYFENAGYPYARVELNDLRYIGNRAIILDYSVFSGELVTIDSLKFIGGEESSRRFLQRQAGVKPGQRYNQDKIDLGEERLERLPYIRVERPAELIRTADGGSVIRYYIKQLPASRFSGILGYLPKSGTEEKGSVVGSFSFTTENLFGSGRGLHLSWNKKDRHSQEVGFRYREPWIFGSPVHADFFIIQDSQDSTFIKRSTGLSAEVPLWIDWSIRGSILTETVIPDEQAPAGVNITSSDAFSGRLELEFDSRDNAFNPVKGVFYSSKVQYSRRNEGAENYLQKLFELDASVLYRVHSRNVLYGRLYGGKVDAGNNKISYSELYSLGGYNSLRGYRERQFRGRTVSLLSLEYRYIFEQYSRMFLFYDLGYVKTVENENLSRQGMGCGLRIATRQGIFGIDFGWGRGDSFGEGKVHVSVNTQL